MFEEVPWGELIESGRVIAGSPETVRQRMEDLIKGLRVGNMFCLMQMGDMPKDKCSTRRACSPNRSCRSCATFSRNTPTTAASGAIRWRSALTPAALPVEAARAMTLKTVATSRVPVRYYEGGSGTPLVFLHGAGGLDMDQPFLDALAQRFHVYAPLVPGYGDSEECPELRDMLDFTLHTWDVVSALGLKDPVLAGFSMGGMIACEMAAIAPNDVSRLALIAPAGLWLDQHPIPDFFAMLPFELPPVLFYDAEAGAKAMTAGVDLSDPSFLQAFLVQNARQLGAAGKILFPIPERGLPPAASTASARKRN